MSTIKRQSRLKKRRGFTLIEMLVSIGLFSVVVTISMGTLLTLVDANSRAQATQVAIDNLSFALDSMTRQIRNGTDYACRLDQDDATSGSGPGTLVTATGDCNGNIPREAFVFTDARTGNRIGYSISGASLQRKVDPSPGAAGTEWTDVTGPNIRVTELKFLVTGVTGSTDIHQPTVSIYIEAEVGDVDGTGATTVIQTSVTQRQLDV